MELEDRRQRRLLKVAVVAGDFLWRSRRRRRLEVEEEMKMKLEGEGVIGGG
jgi:hypothetical protein